MREESPQQAGQDRHVEALRQRYGDLAELAVPTRSPRTQQQGVPASTTTRLHVITGRGRQILSHPIRASRRSA